MLLLEEEVKERIESPLNLINRLQALTRPDNKNKARIPSLPPTSDEVISDLEDKLNVGSIRSKASGILVRTLDELSQRLPEVDKPEKLARIAESVTKVIDSVTPKDKGNTNNIAQVIIYSPRMRGEAEYDVIDVRRLEEQ